MHLIRYQISSSCKTAKLKYCHSTGVSGGSRGPGGPGRPIFGKVNLIFYIVYDVWKKLKLNLDFIVAEIRGVFGSVGSVCVCVWIEIVAATVFCSAKAQFWMISEAILIQKICARLQEIASNFSKFSGGGLQTPRRRLRLRRSVRGFTPLPGPPFQNSWIRPWVWTFDRNAKFRTSDIPPLPVLVEYLSTR